MKTIIRLVEAALTVILVYFLPNYNSDLPVRFWLLLFFGPDFSMLSYLAGTRTSAFTFNLVHQCRIALLIITIGMLNLYLCPLVSCFSHILFLSAFWTTA